MAHCPCCQTEVSPKCGSIKLWHWAHKNADCDPWYEPETAWHKKWKERFPQEYREVAVGNHRADIKTSNLVVELQHSPISAEVIRERESHYGSMVWVFDMQASCENLTLYPSSLTGLYRDEDPWAGQFTWRHAKKSILHCRAPVLLHLKQGLLINISEYGTRTYHHPLKAGLRTGQFGDYAAFTEDAFLDYAIGAVVAPETKTGNAHALIDMSHTAKANIYLKYIRPSAKFTQQWRESSGR